MQYHALRAYKTVAMDRKQAEIRISELKEILNEANRSYYVENSPILSDFDFDMLLKELEALEGNILTC